ncbi:MAG: NAD(P)H-dependent glycerol-3-phosphate dehydrogenase [Nevskiales bacterium]
MEQTQEEGGGKPAAVVAVLGAGSYGTALAIQFARNGHATLLWGRDATALAEMERVRVNTRYLPDCPFPEKLHAVSDLPAALTQATDIVIALPSHAVRETLRQLKPLLRREQHLACAAKGFENDTGKLMHEVFAEELGRRRAIAIISGPTFAKEVGRGVPTAVTVASRDMRLAERFAEYLHGQGFRAYTSDDVIGVEVGGAVKNVLAIGVGAADGLGAGANTRALMITRGLAEMMRLSQALGGKRDTMIGLAGLGDLVLTCTDNQSRNRRMGLLLAGGKSVDEAQKEIGQVVEGVRVAPEVRRLAQRHQLEMPISEMVYRVLYEGLPPTIAAHILKERPLRAESN